tara:strand:- start:218 stop:508 length:291 start_codon:yes stop_codon:yes gene_type:complete
LVKVEVEALLGLMLHHHLRMVDLLPVDLEHQLVDQIIIEMQEQQFNLHSLEILQLMVMVTVLVKVEELLEILVVLVEVVLVDLLLLFLVPALNLHR